jgi:hypothetical protein
MLQGRMFCSRSSAGVCELCAVSGNWMDASLVLKQVAKMVPEF